MQVEFLLHSLCTQASPQPTMQVKFLLHSPHSYSSTSSTHRVSLVPPPLAVYTSPSSTHHAFEPLHHSPCKQAPPPFIMQSSLSLSTCTRANSPLTAHSGSTSSHHALGAPPSLAMHSIPSYFHHAVEPLLHSPFKLCPSSTHHSSRVPPPLTMYSSPSPSHYALDPVSIRPALEPLLHSPCT